MAAETIRARWERDVETDPQTTAAQALEDAGLLMSPEKAAELEQLRTQRDNWKASFEAERKSRNEELGQHNVDVRELRTRLAELEAQAVKVAEFVAARAEYITSIRNCHPDNGHDYDRWQGHAASRRQLAELLGLPVAWPVEDGKAVEKSADRLTRLLAPVQALREDDPNGLHHTYRVGRDLPESGGGR